MNQHTLSAPDATPAQAVAPADWWPRAWRLIWDVAVPLLIFIAAWLPRYALIHSLDLVTDEGVYIPTGIRDVRLLQSGAITSHAWLVNYEAPALPKLLIGLGALSAGPLLGPQGWLVGARLPGALLSTLTFVAAYFLARDIIGRGGAALGALALAVSPWLAFYNSLAYLDSYMLCFVTLVALLTWHAARRPWLWPLVGALGGLAFASKYTAAFIAAPILLYLTLRSLAITRRLPPWQTLLILPIGLLTTWLVDPAIWINPISRFWRSVMFEYHHASHGHEVFWAGTIWQHVPPGLGLYLTLAKLSLFVTVPAALGLLWGLWRVARALLAHRRFTPLDERAAFMVAWLGGLIPFFASLSIIVGTHYVLPLAPPLAFTAGWVWMRAVGWLAPRLTPRARVALAALGRRASDRPRLARLGAEPERVRWGVTLACAALVAIAMLAPSTVGLLTIPQAEGYTAEWLPGENDSLQVAYPAYADAVRWIVAHSSGRTTVTLVMSNRGALDEWMGTRQTLFPGRIRLVVGTPRSFPYSEYIVWPEHLVQRQFPEPPNFNHLVVMRITGGATTYCYILRWPHPNR